MNYTPPKTELTWIPKMTPYLKGDNMLNNHHFWSMLVFGGVRQNCHVWRRIFPRTNLKKMKENQAPEDRIDRNLVCFLGKSWEFLEAGHLFETNMGRGTRLQKDWGKVRESHEFVKIHGAMCTGSFADSSQLHSRMVYFGVVVWCFSKFRDVHIHFVCLSFSLSIHTVHVYTKFIHTVYEEFSRTVDVRNPTNQLSLVVYPIIYRVFWEIPGG